MALLDYSAARPRRLKRWPLIVLAVSGTVAVVLLNVPAVPARLSVLHWQRRSAPPMRRDVVVYEEQADRARSLMATGTYAEEHGGWEGGVARDDRAWRGFLERTGIDGPRSPLALVRLRNPANSQVRFVCLDISSSAGDVSIENEKVSILTSQRNFMADVIAPASLLENASRRWQGDAGVLRIDPPRPVRIYAPQVDPKDASRCTLDYAAAAGERGTMELWIDGSDVVRLRIVDGPGAPSRRPGPFVGRRP